MKKLAVLFGYLALICIALYAWFKIAHFPGADLMVWLGAIFFCLGFAPLWSWTRFKAAENSLNKIISVVAFLTMFFLGVSVIAKALYWGCGMINACIGDTFLIILILLVIIQAFKEGDPWKQLSLHSFSILAGIALTLFTFLQLTTIPKNTLNQFTSVIETQNKEIQYFTGKSNSFFENFDKNAPNADAAGYYEKAKEVNTECDSLTAFIRTMGEDMMFQADKKKVSFDSIQNLCHPYYKKACNETCKVNGKDSIYSVKLEKFRTFMGENTNSRGKEVLDMFFPAPVKDSTQSCGSNSSCCCCCCTLLCQLTDLNATILHIRILQAETMNYLQTMQAKAMLKTVKE